MQFWVSMRETARLLADVRSEPPDQLTTEASAYIGCPQYQLRVQALPDGLPVAG
jgi:hypothetical protein